MTLFDTLYDLEKRAGAGVGLWGQAVSQQAERLAEANRRHQGASSAGGAAGRSEWEQQLHIDAYFLVLAVRRVLLFHDALARHVEDNRLADARHRFISIAGNAERLRHFYEHIDEYLLDSDEKVQKFNGPSAPVIHLVRGRPDLVVSFGKRSLNVTRAAAAAVRLAETTQTVWSEAMERERPIVERPSGDGLHLIHADFGVTTLIDDRPGVTATAVLRGYRFERATPSQEAECPSR